MSAGGALDLPEMFTRNIRQVFGREGEAWLARLPAIIHRCEQRWQLRAGRPAWPLTYNYVAPAERRDGTPVVLKLGVPHGEFTCEVAALRAFAGQGTALVLDADPEQGLLLLERLSPGRMLSRLADDEAILLAAGVMSRLWRTAPEPHPFPSTARWGQGFARLRSMFDGGTGPLPSRLFARAEALYAHLEATAAPAVLLHGDLHQDNILDGGARGWLAIDPKGLVGEPAYETGALLRNPRPLVAGHPHLRRLCERRIALLSDALSLDRERIRGWGMAQAMLSAVWSVEDHGAGWELAVHVAEALA